MTTILNHDDAAKPNRPPQTRPVRQPLWIQWLVIIIGVLFLGASTTVTMAQSPSPSPSPSPGISPSPSPSPGISPSPSPSPGPSCSPIANASMTISGGGGPFNPTSLTINPATRVTWTNVGNDRARVRDVAHTFLDSGDFDPGQSFSFTWCVPGTYQIEDARGSATATIVVTGTGPSPSPSPGTSPSPSPSPGTSPSPSPSPGTSPSPSPSPGTSPSPSPSPGTSPSPSPSPSPAAQPVNISTRVRVEAGEGVMIGGFIITGNEPKRVIIRGMGPSMSSVGVLGVINDPILRLFNPAGSPIAVNNNWQDTQQVEIEGTGLAPQDLRESAIIATLPPAAYTATVADANGNNGVGLVEIYDLNSAANARLGNISTRGSVQTAENVMIGGFALGGSSINPAKIVVRALGPSLQTAGIANPLSNPILQLFNSNGQAVISNDNWQDVPSQAAELQTLGLAPTNPVEAALVATLSPGLYTAVVAGHSGGTGIGLIEVYGVQ